MRKKPDWRLIGIAIVILLYVFSAAPTVRDASDNPDRDPTFGAGWRISGVRGDRMKSFRSCDATKDMIYFCYSMESLIDAYDNQGKYQYTITLKDRQNGGTSIFCTDDLLYARAKDGTVFVFRGTEMLYTMERPEGIPFDSGKNLEVTKESVFRIDKEGDRIWQCDTPEEIRINWPKFDLTANPATIILLLVLLFTLWIGVVVYCIKGLFRRDS